MGTGSGFPIDLILFGMIAAFLVLRLRSILGRRTGFERPPQPYQPPPTASGAAPIIEGRAEHSAPAATRPVPDPASELGQTLSRMRVIDRRFDPAGFLVARNPTTGVVMNALSLGALSFGGVSAVGDALYVAVGTGPPPGPAPPQDGPGSIIAFGNTSQSGAP